MSLSSNPLYLNNTKIRKQSLSFITIVGITILLILGLGLMPKESTKIENDDKIQDFKLTVLYDNNWSIDGLKTDWGFSCLVEYGAMKLLFDTGANGTLLLDNMKKLNIDPKEIDCIFLSHSHSDHIGGLLEFLKKNPNVTIYYPESFPDKLIKDISISDAKLIPVSSFNEIQPNIFTLGEFKGAVPEQVLAVRSLNGIVIITGCAHPGIINILKKAKTDFPNEKIYLPCGGFHLYKTSNDEISKIVQEFKNLDIDIVAPTHCTGNNARKMFKGAFQNSYIKLGVGEVIKIGAQ